MTNTKFLLLCLRTIAFANYSYRLIDILQILEEFLAQKLKRLVFGKLAQFLRNAGALFNKIEICAIDLGQLKEFCTLYFNLYDILPTGISLNIPPFLGGNSQMSADVVRTQKIESKD